MRQSGSFEATDELVVLASGSMFSVLSYPSWVVNGVKFISQQRDSWHTTQNCGVYVPGMGGDNFYGQLDDVLVLS